MKALIRSFGLSLPRFACLAAFAACAPAQAVTFTNDTALSFDNPAYDGQDIIVSNCTLTVEGPHTFASLRVAAGATLTHSVSPTGLIVSLLTVTNDLLTLTGTNSVTLPHSNIVTGTLRVTDASATVVFTSDLDYVLSDLGDGLTGLQRTTNSAIPDGSVVLVSYDVLLSSIGAGMNLIVSGDVEVEAGASINADGRGYSGNNGSGNGGETGGPPSGGGGAHGGNGGLSSSNALGGVAYGAISTPSNLGSGGGFGSTGMGGAGGGLIRLNVRSNVTIHGMVSANGQNGVNSRSGGGAGGSIWITAQSLTGNGTISANGGNGEPVHGGGGGGGRIALTVATNLFTGTIPAYGGSGFQRGGAGTVFRRSGTSVTSEQVVVDNGGVSGASTPYSTTGQPVLRVAGGAVVAPANFSYVSGLLVESNSWLTSSGSTGLELTVTRDALFQTGGGINLRGKGYASGQGTGAGGFYSTGPNGAYGSGGGGGHAGYGGMGTATNLSRGGNYYDYANSPAQPGSGGGGNPYYPGGAGGGLLLLTVNGALQLDGSIVADGERPPAIISGGGSGGSVRLTAGTLAGAGRVSVNGGSAYAPNGGGGSGGRIVVSYGTNLFVGTFSAVGGTGFRNGAAGTIFLQTKNQNLAQLIADNGGLAGTNTALTMATSYPAVDLTLQNGAVAFGVTSFRNLTVRSNSTLLLNVVTSQQTVSVTGDARIEPGAALSLDGLGYASGSGQGAGRYSTGSYPYYTGSGGGGGHGGYGGMGFPSGSQTMGGNAYDLLTAPNQAGSGGGGNTAYPGGSGGGALRFNVTGLLQLDGRISADGLSATNGGAGGGSGGSLWLAVGGLSGGGVLSANGGAGDSPNGGGGGGGRIMVTYSSNAFAGTVSARGGAGYVAGGAGPIYFKATTSSIPQVTMDNGGLRGTNTLLDSLPMVDLTIRGGAYVAGMGSGRNSFRSLFIGSDSWLTTSTSGQSDSWTVSGNATIEAGGGVTADGRGYRANQGLLGGAGRYWSSGSSGGGGGHGGFGGHGAAGPTSAAGGAAYGYSTILPSSVGSGGGNLVSTSGTPESAGGGALSLTVNGTLLLNGSITANGLSGTNGGSGGGAGGSLLLTVGKLTGNGVIAADGGAGDSPNGGGGGGGRIAVYWHSNDFSGTILARGGAGFLAGGAGTIYLKSKREGYGQMIVDNGGERGTNTRVGQFSGVRDPLCDLAVRGGAIVSLDPATDLLSLVVSPKSAVLMSNQAVLVRGNASIQEGGAILADGTGLGPGTGSDANINYQWPRPGGSHAGVGGLSTLIVSYGSVWYATGRGSGGGNAGGNNSAPFGGAGGGEVKLDVHGTLTLDGRVSANGRDGGLNSGGGAGGSVLLHVGTLAGAGTITADGGAGNGLAGGGGGGRVSISFYTNLFSGSVRATGGGGASPGGAGTVYWRQTGTTNKWLVVNNGGLANANFTPLTGLPSEPVEFSVSNGAVVFPQSTFPMFKSVNVGADGTITCLNSQARLELAALGDVNVAPGGMLAVDRRGYSRNTGAGRGGLLSGQGGGAGHGGAGGESVLGAVGGAVYGSEVQPLDRGSGGGSGGSGASLGSEGGGAIRLSVGGTLSLDGRLSANGNAGSEDDSGGGSGGSVWVRANEMTGGGMISANGGDGEWFSGGGGGGGRIAVYSPANTFTGLVSVVGGLGANAGQSGTVFQSTNVPGFDIVTHSPAGVVSNVVFSADFTFSDMVNPSSISAEDIFVITPSGILAQTNLSVSTVGLFTMHVTFPIQNQAGDYAVLAGPEIEGLFAQPMSQVYTGAFTVVLPTLSGVVTNLAGEAVTDAVVQPDGGLPAALTDAAGRYSFGVPPGWVGTVTPTLATNMFVPGVRIYTNVAESVTNENYLMVETIAPELTSVAAGTNLWLNWSGIPGVSYQVWSSTNLADWYPWGDAILGTNGPMDMPLPSPDQPMQFFRLQADN